jgi:non-ribosomal peptide synthetase-like protein
MLETAEALDASWLDAEPAPGTATQPECLHALFERQADLRGEVTALICAGRSLSYLELDRRANRLARSLRRLGVRPGVLVGLCLDRSELPIIAILGCLKAGGAYVPLEPGFPDQRMRHILAEAQVGAVLTEANLECRISRLFAGPMLVLDRQARQIAAESGERFSSRETGLTAEDICYVLYTSGTTGRPKGVVTEHRNVTHFVRAFNEVCTTTPADRIFQGFSLGFDGSVEEIWMAFSNGATLVVGTPETPKFGNDLARHLSAEGVTYFSTVPTMLSTMTEDVPSLRQLVVSGEACPPELVGRWAKTGRRMLNVYGPTEATVNTTAALCEPGRPVTIGRPLDGYHVLILDADMEPVLPGATGELYVAGAGLARGYLNQPELTARAFVRHGASRLYRTGDLARVNAEGEIEFFGRIDAQVKIRGFRVELAEIETVLLEQDDIVSAAVRLHDNDGVPVLAAYVVLDEAAGELDRGRVLAAVRARLPNYMVPAYLDVLDDLPMLSSGKVDRRRLPQPVLPLVAASDTGAEPATPLEAQIAAIWGDVFGAAQVGPTQDFFLDLGGHSLFAAQAVAALRERAGIHVAVRDLYAHSSVRKLARHVEAKQPAAKAEAPDAPAPLPSAAQAKPGLLLLTAQFGSMLLALALFSLPLVVVIPIIADFLAGRSGLVPTLVSLAALALVLWPVAVGVGLGAKWLIIGRYRRGAYPLWGSYYFRWWLVSRLQALSGAGAFIGTPLMPVYYRLMGAKVGRRCALDTALCSAWDMVSIGDDTSIGADTQLLGCRVENGQLLIGRVEIGSRCFVGLHSAFGLDVRMGDDARLDDQSLLPDGEHIPAGEGRSGSPARPAEVDAPAGHVVRHSRARRLAFTLAQVFSAAAVGLMAALPGLSVLLAVAWLVITGSIGSAMALVFAAPPVMVVVYCLWIAAMKALVLPNAAPGTYELHTLADLRYWLAGGMMRASRGMFLPVFTTLYLPPWMRLLGARIGRHSEMSTVFCFLPDLLTAGNGSFFADGSILGGRRTHCGRFEIGPVGVGHRSFIGNGAILPPGAGLGDEGLLGVLSAPPERARPTPDGTDWLGSPAFLLPNRHKVAGFDDEVTYAPTRKLYAQRAVIDTLRILIPAYTGTLLGLGGLIALLVAHAYLGPWLMLTLVLPLAIAAVTIAVLVVVGLKWAVMGAFRPVIVPLWCPYVWLNEMVNGAYESIMGPVVAAFFGTPLAPVLLRLLGCRIGRTATSAPASSPSSTWSALATTSR